MLITAFDWQASMDEWAHAHGRPGVSGVLKEQPQDFQVREQMDVIPLGEGEHIWLLIRKTRQNTDQVAKQLARFSGVNYRDVGFSGLKDFFAVTEQWFSVYLPKAQELNWSAFEMSGVEILETTRHTRKIKRGTHQENYFSIEVRKLKGDVEGLASKLALIDRQGVPNYFGPQRFGRKVSNIPQVIEMFQNNKNVKNRNLKSILISAARSWLFNTIVSERIKNESWQRLWPGEPANLNGSASIFYSGTDENNGRLRSLDIHPTAPLWGKLKNARLEDFKNLYAWELNAISDYKVLSNGLEQVGVVYQRRPTRMQVRQLKWQLDADNLNLSFALQKGQFATSVIRELIAA